MQFSFNFLFALLCNQTPRSRFTLKSKFEFEIMNFLPLSKLPSQKLNLLNILNLNLWVRGDRVVFLDTQNGDVSTLSESLLLTLTPVFSFNLKQQRQQLKQRQQQ